MFNVHNNLLSHATTQIRPSLTPPSSNPVSFPNEPLKEIEVELSEVSFKISARQFAHRLVPAYLDKEDIVGTNSLASCNHWIELISLWTQDKCVFLPHAIAKKDLEHLLTVLKEYRIALERDKETYKSENKASACRKSAKMTLNGIQEGLKQRNTFYTPLGYAHSPTSGGHVLPLKLCKQGKNKIEAVFLNLGQGLEMHPQVDWCPSGLRFHFQSFPVEIDRSTLSSSRCEDVFTRLMLLKAEPCPPSIQSYSSKDVYVPVYSLGNIQSSFNSKIADRSRKPQLGDICADMAILLIIKDVLTDRGYQKETIQRFVTLEKLCDILFFHRQLCKDDGPLDDWLLLKNGLKELSVRGLKSHKTVLSDKELEWLYQLFQPLFSHTFQQIKLLKNSSLPITSLLNPGINPLMDFISKTSNPLQKKYGTEIPKEKVTDYSCGTPSILSLKPEEALQALSEWLLLVEGLREKNASKAHAFVYRAFCSLEIPDQDSEGFWDQVPATDISNILTCLQKLAFYGTDRSVGENDLIYRNALILSIGYAIADRLVRRKYPSYFLEFQSPFYPSRFVLRCFPLHSGSRVTYEPKDSFFEFWMLPPAQANIAWTQIRNYFEKPKNSSKYILFALFHKEIDIHQGLKNLEHVGFFDTTPYSYVADHLKFLEQFMNEAFPKNSVSSLSTEEKFTELWMNTDCHYIPREIEILYSFAYNSTHSFLQTPENEASFHVSREIPKKNCIKILSSYTYKLVNDDLNFYLGEPLTSIKPWEACSKLSENRTQCLEYNDLSSPKWNTQLERQWTRIFSNTSLQISSLIQWMRNNIALLCQKNIQQLIEIGLFMPALLAKKLKEEPSTIDQLRDLVSQAITRYSKSSFNNSTCLFLLRLGICIEGYAKQPSIKTLAIYETNILESIAEAPDPTTLYQYLLFLYQSALPQDERSLRELIKAQFWLTYHENDKTGLPLWISCETQQPLERYHQTAKDYFKQNEWLEQTFAEVYTLITRTNKLPQEDCIGKYPLIQKGKYQIDIENICIFADSKQLVYINKQSRQTFPALEEKKGLAWRDSQSVDILSESGFIRIEIDKKGLCAFVRRFEFYNQPTIPKWFQLSKIDPRCFGGSLLADATYFDHWVDKTHEKTIVICKKNDLTPIYIAIKEDSGFQISKISRGAVLHTKLFNIWAQDCPMKDLFERLGATKETCVWEYKPGTISAFEFLQLDLKFYNEMNRFYSQNYPDYYLAEEQSLEELNGFTGALILEPLKKENHKMVLIPARKLERKDKNFSTVVTMKEDFLPVKDRLFLYQLDESTHILNSPAPEANLFLTLLLAMQRDYHQALFYLDRSRSYSDNKQFSWAVEAFSELRDHSPEALIFYLRLGLHFIHSSQQVILNEYGKVSQIKGGLEIKFLKWVADKMSSYLRIHSTQKSSRVPESIRLSKEEEIFLLKFLENSLSKLDWQEVFNVRLSLLQNQKRSTKICSALYPIYRCELLKLETKNFESSFRWKLPDFSPSNTSLQDFVRMDEKEVRRNFISLYERACQGQAEIDLFYLSRSDASNNVCLAYSVLLHYVQKNPEEFKTLKFGNDSAENQMIFQEIIKKVASAKKGHIDSFSTVNKLLKDHSVFFDFKKSIDLALPSLPILNQDWPSSNKENTRLQKLQNNVFKHFQIEWLEILQEPLLSPNIPFAFASMNNATETPTMQMQLAEWHEGYTKLIDPAYGKSVFSLKKEKTVLECLTTAKNMLSGKLKKNLKLKEQTEKIANSYPEMAYLLGLRKLCTNLPEITIEGILTKAYQNKNTMEIKKANPSLQSEQINALILNTIEYHIRRIHIYQLERAIVELEKNASIQGFAEALVFHGKFNPLEEPEIILYQSRTGKILRKSQAELFAWEIETSTGKLPPIRLFTAQAGDGKTSLFQPIAMKRLARLGYTPISVSSKPLYVVDREGLKESSQHIFSFELDVLELDLNTEARAIDFQWFYEQLTQNNTNKGFKITPEVYFSLHLKYQLALENEDIESVRWLSQIFSFLKAKGVALIDECRLNCSPFTQAKIGIGRPISLPEIDRIVILEIYQAFMKDVKEIVGLQNNQQATMTKEERQYVKKTVLSNLAQSPLLGIPLDQQPVIVTYWLNETPEPQWLLQKADPRQSRAIDLIKVYFDEYFKKSMKLICGMQHVRSIRSGEEIYVPARAKQPSRAYFDDVYMTLIVTIQGYLHQGLDMNQVQNLLKELDKKATEEVGSSGDVSLAERNLTKWMGKENIVLNRISAAQLSQDTDFYKQVHKNPEVIFWYLEHVVFKQIQFSPEQLTVTPTDFLHAFHSITVFSADRGPDEIYGVFKQGPNAYTNPLSFVQAIHKFLDPSNAQFLTFSNPTSPLEFYHSLLKQDPTIFSHLRMICDAGGTLRNFTAKEIVSDLFTLLDSMIFDIELDGVIIFEEASAKETETELLLWLKTWEKPKIIKGHDVVQALQALGIHWDQLKLLAIIDPSHRTGANIELPKESSILVLLGEELTISNWAQGTLRGRGVLSGDQRVILGAEQKLAQSISKEISAQKSAEWTARNGAKTADQEVLLAAYQQIDYFIKEPVWDMIKQKDPKTQIFLWHQHRKSFVNKAEIDPIQRFKGKRSAKPTKDLLLAYADEKFKLFGHAIPWSKAEPVKLKLKPIIESIAKRQPELSCSSSFNASGLAYVHAYQQEEMRKEFIANFHVDLKAESSRPISQKITIDKNDFVDVLSKCCQPASQLFNSEFLTNGLWFTEDAIYTAKTGPDSLKENYLKPVQYILITNENLTWNAFALSDGEGEFFQNQLNVFQKMSCKCALLSADGHIVQNGKNGFGFSAKELQDVFIQDVIIDVSLTRCELNNPLRFIERIDTWADFWPMWNKIKKCQPLAYTGSTQLVEKHVPKHIRDYVPIVTEQPSILNTAFKFIFG